MRKICTANFINQGIMVTGASHIPIKELMTAILYS